ITVLKQVVDAGVEGGVSGNDYIDVKSIDKWRSIQITSRLDPDSLPGSLTWGGTTKWSFPPELSDAIIDWASAFCECSSSFSAILVANMKQYSGTVVTRMTEQFFNGPPPPDVLVTQF